MRVTLEPIKFRQSLETEFWKLTKFALSGVSVNGILILGVYGLELLGMASALSLAIGYVVGVITSFLVNHFWTFRSSKSHIGSHLGRFVLVYVVGFGFSEACLYLFENLLSQPEFLALVGTVLATAALNFTLLRLWVYRS